MAFAGNDLVNFIGVPLAGLDSFQDFISNANGADSKSFMMHSLSNSAKTPMLYLLIAGGVMILAMATSHKAHNVIKTSVGLSRQDEGDEMFGSSRAARSIVRITQNITYRINAVMPIALKKVIDKRFSRKDVALDAGVAFDYVRASVNLVLAAMLITIGTNYKLPLSTTYVTFMVAMGSSLADRAWSRESAVFRVTGVLSVIGGWFITEGVAFLASSIICALMFYGGMIIKILFMALVIFSLIRSNIKYKNKIKQREKNTANNLMMRLRDPLLIWEALQRHVSKTQANINIFTQKQLNNILEAFVKQDVTIQR